MNTSAKKSFSVLGWILWIVAALFFLYEFFLRTFLGALAKQIIPTLHLSASQFALLASVFYISYGVMQVPVGLLVDKFGVKACQLFAILTCFISAFLFSSVHTFGFALLYRFLMGFGGAFAFMCLLITTILWFPEKYLAFLVGLGQFIGTLGALIAGGPLAALVTSRGIPWRLVFMGIGALGACLFLVSLFVRQKKDDHRKDYLIFIHKKSSLKAKLGELFSSKQAFYVALYSSFVFLSLAMLGAVWGTLFLQSHKFTQEVSAYIVSLGWLGFALGCPFLGFLSDKLLRRKPIMVLASLLGFIAICLTVYVSLKSPWLYGLCFFVIGLTGAGQSVGFATITEHVQKESQSVALGLNSSFITLLAAIMPLIVGWIMDGVTQGVKSSAAYVPKEFTLAFSVMPLLYFLSLILALFFIKETYCRSNREVIKLHPKDKESD